MENPAQPVHGLRAVAVFEAAKGLLVLLAGSGLLLFLHRDLHALAAECLTRLHLNPARHTARVFLDAAAALTDARLWALAVGAAAYAAARLVEAYGLWRGRRWAAWLSVVSAGLYLPVEVFELFRGVTPVKAGALVLNLAILLHVARALGGRRGDPNSPACPPDSPPVTGDAARSPGDR
jgi:uncharacterized membrane protein (DUF2068 family)